MDAERLQLEARDLLIDVVRDVVDVLAELVPVASAYSAESAWLAKDMSMTAAGWPSAAARLTSRPSAIR